MSNVEYALMPSARAAQPALLELKRRGVSESACNLITRNEVWDEGSIPVEETDLRSGAAKGALVGGVLGALAGLIIGPFALLGAGPLAALAFGAGAGVYGALGQALFGAGAPNERLERLQEAVEAGGVLIIVDAPNASQAGLAREVLMKHGGKRDL